jgi:hypothetical protein
MKPMIRIHDTLTDEVIDREMTDAEFAEYEAEKQKDAAEAQAKADLEATNAAHKAALLERLGITADEAKLLLS